MKYSTEVLINKPREEVVRKMDSIDNLKHWQAGLVKTEHLSGTPGTFGAKMKMTYDFGKRKMELVETITKRNLPEEFHATYNAKGMHNMQQNYFEIVSENQTKWISNNEFLPTTFFMRVMTFLMPSAFKKQTLKYMTDFKNFVENGTSVADA